jgi:hypothetical protein
MRTRIQMTHKKLQAEQQANGIINELIIDPWHNGNVLKGTVSRDELLSVYAVMDFKVL